MNIPEAKVYFDGSNYIAIAPKHGTQTKPTTSIKAHDEKKELFEKLYKDNIEKKKSERKEIISKELREHFETDEQCKEYVKENMNRKTHNKIVRKTRLIRKVNQQTWNYFVTFTYDDKKHDETRFRKKLRECLSRLSTRKGWKYIGVWERSPEKQRLHFHGLFNVPSMVGELIEVNDWDSRAHKRRTTLQNTFFSKRFGRNDFSIINEPQQTQNAVRYIVKYLEKSGERIVYSKGLYEYFISDIMDEDIICPYNSPDEKQYCDNKYILFDNFRCWDEGLYMGDVCPETIAKLRKTNR